MKKIDIHCHTTKRNLSHTICSAPTIDTIELAMSTWDIGKTVLLATYFPKRGTGISNFRLYDWVKEKPHFMMFASLDFETYFYQGYNEIEEMAERKLIKGVKIYHGYQAIEPRKMETLLALCLKYKLPVMLHTGDCINTNGFTADTQSIEWILNYDLNFIFSHLNNPNLEKMVWLLKKYPNLYTDISGLLNSKTEKVDSELEKIKYFYNECGTDRLLFGTDFPVQTHVDSVYMACFLAKMASAVEMENFYYKNASRLLNL